MGERPGVFDHGVLVRAEAGECLVDEMTQPRERTAPRGRPGAVRRSTRQTVREIPHHGLVERIEATAARRRPRVLAPGRRFAVLRVEVPATSRRPVTFHQQPEAPSLPAVKKLHAQGRLALRPVGERLAVAEKLVGSHERDAVGREAALRVPGGGFHRDHAFRPEALAVLGKAGGKGGGPPVVHIEAGARQLDGKAPHRGDIEMGPLNVPGFASELRLVLNQQHPHLTRAPVRETRDPAVQLIAEYPYCLHGGAPCPHIPGCFSTTRSPSTVH